MTHGCIVVKRSDEKKREVLLHTYHSGYLIPDIVKAIPAFICKHRWSFLLAHENRYPTMKALKEGVLNSFDDGMYYQLTVAGLLVAESPWMLEVVPPEFVKDHWANESGHHTLLMNEETHNWTLYNEENQIILSIDPTEEMFKWLWAEIKKKRKAKK